jgi:hypothetical protein
VIATDIATQVTDAFNRFGPFTARTIDSPHAPATEIRYLDTGKVAATVWPPVQVGREVKWMWLGGQPGMGTRYLPERATLDELVRAVATHVLDESTGRTQRLNGGWR